MAMDAIDPAALLAVADAADGLGVYAKLQPDTVRELVAAYESLARVRGLHHETPHDPDDLHVAITPTYCRDCSEPWPCEVIRLIGDTPDGAPVDHYRTGPARCACGYDAYEVGGFFPDYLAMFGRHIAEARRAEILGNA